MTSFEHHQVIILGSGPAGLTAAVYAARASLKPLLLHGPLPGGQLTTTTEVENFPGFPDGIMGPELMEKMEAQAKRFGTDIRVATVTKVSLGQAPFQLETSSGNFSCDGLIVATGATPKLLGVPLEKELTGYGVSTCATCDGAFFRQKRIAVSGGGDSACEEALFLTKFGSEVFLIHRRDALRASKIMQERVLNHPKIKVLWNKRVESLQGSRESGLTSIDLKDTLSGNVEALACDALFIAIGHTPNSALLTGQIEMDQNGYVITAPNSTATNIAGVFVCGDLQDHVYRQAITAAGTGCMAAIELERWLAH